MSEELKDTNLEAPETTSLGLSDDEFMKMDFDEYVSSETESDESQNTSDEVEESDTTETEEDDADGETNTAESDSEDDVTDGDSDTSDEGESESSDKDTEEDEPSEIDPKAELDKLFKPFKANGKEIKVDSVDEAITLMQMGANYNKKMAALKPNLKLLKTLENNGLLDESKLNYLIDLDKKNPEAIKKFIKESGIDPLDIDTTSDVNYEPNTYTVDDRELELDAVLERIQDTPSYNKTIDVISNKWDEKSREVLVNNPGVIEVINSHMDNGVYDQVMSVVEKERVMGRLQGMSDIEAYKLVGDQLFVNQANQQVNAQQKPVAVKRPQASKPDPKVASRKKAASTTKSAPKSKAPADFNPLAMSDAEFEKLVNEKFI
jgi:hypothetical protein